MKEFLDNYAFYSRNGENTQSGGRLFLTVCPEEECEMRLPEGCGVRFMRLAEYGAEEAERIVSEAGEWHFAIKITEVWDSDFGYDKGIVHKQSEKDITEREVIVEDSEFAGVIMVNTALSGTWSFASARKESAAEAPVFVGEMSEFGSSDHDMYREKNYFLAKRGQSMPE